MRNLSSRSNSDTTPQLDEYESDKPQVVKLSAAKRAQLLEDRLFDKFDRLEREWKVIRYTVNAVKWLPPFVIFLVLCFCYYVMAYLFCYLQLYTLGQYFLTATLCFCIFNIIFVLNMISFLKAIYCNPGIVPESFYDRVKSVQYSPLAEQFIECPTCEKPKPPRSHHCRHCKACIRKMDHHCPVVNNCVGWGNYKYFVLLLTWSCIMCWYGVLCGIIKLILIGFTSNYIVEIQIVVGLFISIAYSITLVIFAGMHYYMISKNKSTLDNIIFKKNKNIYDIGEYNNFCQVFGDDPIYWFLPIFTSKGDGCSFPINDYCKDNETILEYFPSNFSQTVSLCGTTVDTFCYGMILFDLMTGKMPSWKTDSNNPSSPTMREIMTNSNGTINYKDWIDKAIPISNTANIVSCILFGFGKDCTRQDQKERPSMLQVVTAFKRLGIA